MNSDILNHLNKSININPFFSDSYHLLASLYLKDKEYDLAIKNLKKAIQIEEKIIKAQNENANKYAKLHIFSKIKIIKNKIDQCRKKLSNYLLMLGKIFHASNKKLEAINYFKSSLKYDSDLAESYYYLSIIISDQKKAKKYLDRAIEIDPEYSIKKHENSV